MSEDIESPYCEVCGTCGYIGCCGIRNFIEEHIEGKTNCKNEDIIINELISLCDYKDEVFEENKRLHSIIKEVRKYIEHETFKRNVLVGVSTKKYTKDILNNISEILDKEGSSNE